MSIIRELHTRLSRLTWRETAKADEWSRPLMPNVGVGFMQTYKELAECQMLANAVLIALNKKGFAITKVV